MASEISGQNSSTIISNFFKANTFNSGIGSSRREMIPAENKIIKIKINQLIKLKNIKVIK